MAEDQEKQRQLMGLARMLNSGKISAKEYQEHKRLLIGEGEDIPDPALSEVRASEVVNTGLPVDEDESYYLRFIAEQARVQTSLIRSIRGWVAFFGVLTIVSLIVWVIILA